MTRQQRRCFDYIEGYIGEYGIAPSFDEIRDHLGLRSKSGVFRLVNALEEQGRIRRQHFRARGIDIVTGLEAAAGNLLAAYDGAALKTRDIEALRKAFIGGRSD